MEINADGVNKSVDILEVKYTAKLWARQSDTSPCSINMYPKGWVVLNYLRGEYLVWLDDEAKMDLPISRISARLSTAPEEVLPMVATWGEKIQFSSFGPEELLKASLKINGFRPNLASFSRAFRRASSRRENSSSAFTSMDRS